MFDMHYSIFRLEAAVNSQKRTSFTSSKVFSMKDAADLFVMQNGYMYY